jgi:hypothetical protein
MADASTAVGLGACIFLAACGSVVRPGLANGPVLGGASPETRVHDAIANDHDACERSLYGEGSVLRGGLAACREPGAAETTGASPPPNWIPDVTTWRAEPPALYPFGVCATGLRPRIFGAERSLTAYALSGGRWWLSCDLHQALE